MSIDSLAASYLFPFWEEFWIEKPVQKHNKISHAYWHIHDRSVFINNSAFCPEEKKGISS